jgi:hypothetical protein
MMSNYRKTILGVLLFILSLAPNSLLAQVKVGPGCWEAIEGNLAEDSNDSTELTLIIEKISQENEQIKVVVRWSDLFSIGSFLIPVANFTTSAKELTFTSLDKERLLIVKDGQFTLTHKNWENKQSDLTLVYEMTPDNSFNATTVNGLVTALTTCK